MPCSHPTTSALGRKPSSHEHHCVVGEEGTQVWTTAISGGLFCQAVSSAFLCGHPVSFPLPTSHARTRDSTLAPPASFVERQAGLAVTGNTGGKGSGSGHPAGVIHGRLLSSLACLPLLKTLTVTSLWGSCGHHIGEGKGGSEIWRVRRLSPPLSV